MSPMPIKWPIKWPCYECNGKGSEFDASHSANKSCSRCKGTGELSSEQGRMTDCVKCGQTNAQYKGKDGAFHKAIPGMGAGFITRMQPGTYSLTMEPTNAEEVAALRKRPNVITTNDVQLCPSCAPPLLDYLHANGLLKS